MLHKLSAQVVGTVLVVAVAAADLLVVLLAGVGPGGVGATVGEHPELNREVVTVWKEATFAHLDTVRELFTVLADVGSLHSVLQMPDK